MQLNHDTYIGIPQVIISSQGIFKYILIQAIVANHTLYFVRGSNQLQYHAQNYQKFSEELKNKGYNIVKDKEKNKDPNQKKNPYFIAELNGVKIKCQCLGGGRIQHNYKGKKCFIYGYSKSYGKVDHKIAQKMISKSLGYNLEEIKTSTQGY